MLPRSGACIQTRFFSQRLLPLGASVSLTADFGYLIFPTHPHPTLRSTQYCTGACSSAGSANPRPLDTLHTSLPSLGGLRGPKKGRRLEPHYHYNLRPVETWDLLVDGTIALFNGPCQHATLVLGNECRALGTQRHQQYGAANGGRGSDTVRAHRAFIRARSCRQRDRQAGTPVGATLSLSQAISAQYSICKICLCAHVPKHVIEPAPSQTTQNPATTPPPRPPSPGSGEAGCSTTQ